MKKIAVKVFIIILAFCFGVLCACSPDSEPQNNKQLTVTLLGGEHYTVLNENKVAVTRGETVTFSVEVEEGYRISGYFGDRCLISNNLGYFQTITFEEVKFNLSAQLETVALKNTIIYDMGDGIELVQDCTAIIEHHERANTLTAKNLIDGEYFEGSYDFREDDRLLAGWLTEDGNRIGLGSKVAVSDENHIKLFPLWKEYTDKSFFTVSGGMITGFSGEPNEKGEVVIPNEIGGEQIVGIASLAFEGCNAKSYYLPNTITRVDTNAFLNCTELTDFYMSDNLSEITDSSFSGCANFTTLHLSAYLKPRYASTDFAHKMEVYERMSVNADSGKKKLVLLGGSSVRYGYNTKVIKSFLEDYDIYNCGLNASTCGFAQYQLFCGNLRAGDIFLHAPELFEEIWSGVSINSVITGKSERELTIRVMYLCESNWDMFSSLTVNRYGDLFSNYRTLNSLRKTIPEGSYADYCETIGGDELGGINSFAENVYAENGENIALGNNGGLRFEGQPLFSCMTMARDDMYKPLIERGVNVCVTFPPVNRHYLYGIYGTEVWVQAGADSYTQWVKSVMDDTDVKILLSQYQTVYDGKCFYDTDYHLGFPSRDVHTEKVIKALVEAVAN